LSAHPRHSPEQPQVDLLDLHPASAGDQRVTKLVRQDAREQEQRAD